MAGSGDDKLREQHELSDTKWVKAFRKTKITDPDNIEDKESKLEVLSWIATAHVESISLRKALGILDPVSGSEEEMHDVLEEAGLDVKYWVEVLSKQFGVITSQGLDGITGLFYPHLVQFARSTEEQRALKSFLKMDEIELSEYYNKYILGLNERASQMEYFLRKLEEYQSEEKNFEDEGVKTLCKSLLEFLLVPKEFWFSDSTYDTFIESFKALHELMALDREMVEDCVVVKQASNGLPLKGVLKQGNYKIDTKNVVLNAPEGVVLQLPCLSQSVKHIHCNGKEEEALATAMKPMPIVQRRAHEGGYFSTIKVFLVPLALCSFNTAQLKLSEEAIEQLSLIATCEDVEVRTQCEIFLNSFGSHVCLGPFHFGGTYKWHCHSHNLNQVEVEEAKVLQNRVIEMHECMSKPPKNPEVSEMVQCGTQCSKKVSQKTFLEISTSGVAETAISVALWKNHLVVDKGSWEVLDCGTEHYPIWDIVAINHQDCFEDLSFVAKLKETWEAMCFNMECLPTRDSHVVEVGKCLNSWVKKKNISNCNEHLNYLIKARESRRMDIEIWPKYYLSLPQMQKYLMFVVDICKNGKSSVVDSIKGQMRRVLAPADLEAVPEFPDRDAIRRWVFDTDKPHALIEYNDLTLDIEYCFKFAKKVFNPSIPTTVVNNTMCHLLTHMRKTCQIYDELFIGTLLLPFRYAMHNVIYLRGPVDVILLQDVFQKHTENYFKVKNQNNIIKLQAYLVLLAINIVEDIDIGTFSRLCAHLKVILRTIGRNISPVVQDALCGIMDKSISTEIARTILKRLMEATLETGITSEVEIAVAKAVEPLKPEMTARNFERILSEFDLHSKYPQKITLLQALEVKEDSIEESNVCKNGKQYPFMVMQKLLSFDHRCFLKLEQSPIRENVVVQLFRRAGLVSTKDENLVVNPLDGLITVLLCADNFLRQELMSRLATCQIAIPLVLPDPKQQNLTLTIWAMRTIVKQWQYKSEKDSTLKVHEVSITTYPMPAISFLRFGTHKVSKSKLINMVMNDSSHATFFHYDCDGGSAPKLLTDGMIDIAWHLPSTGYSFGDAVTFLNLHGDARNLKSQIKFLSEICFMHFILLNVEDLDELGCEVLQILSKAPGGVVLLQNGRMSGASKTKRIKTTSVIELDKKNEAETKTDIRETIKQCVSKRWKSKSLPNAYENAARRSGILVDEDDVRCAEAKSLANEFKGVLDRIGKTTNPKDLLELQGAKYWHKVAAKEKEKYRQKKDKLVRDYRDDVEYEIGSIRREQHDCVRQINGNPSFLGTVCTLRNREVRNYYLRWVKMILDELSRKKLPPLYNEYKQIRANLKNAKEANLKKCQQEVQELNMKLIDASFGLEHLLREIGQIYEASAFIGSVEYQFLPNIVAELMIEGYPLEIMDGDTAHVPINWITAVLNQVKLTLNDPSIFVLAILGIQSSGKSTLLNTLFGVNFNVSAGRCTRGAFMQLLPFHKTFKKAKYLLLIDTEGLRAPELDATQTHNHDNQLGTFVVGLAHLTVVNILGEVSPEMNDILQTAVHAFLRMKNVGVSRPGCHFVHQNVTALMASDKGMMGKTKLKENLDKMTKVAAKEEGLERQYTSFNDVMHFDDEEDVTYFPTLWFGNPPMAPVNPMYCMQAGTLKMSLIKSISSCQMKKFSKFIGHFETFWHAILQENFIFSFKNTLEMSVYSTLDSQRSKWFWRFRKKMIICEDNFEKKICNFRGADSLGEKLYQTEKKKVKDTVSQEYVKIMAEVKVFFKERPEREILINWESETMRLLDSLHDELGDHAEQHCKLVLHNKHSQRRIDEIKSRHQNILSVRVRDLVFHLNSMQEPMSLSRPQLEIKFEEEWNECIKALESQIPEGFREIYDIELEVEKALKDHFKRQLPVLTKKMTPSSGGKPLEEWGETLSLAVTREHISVFPSMLEWIMSFIETEQWRNLAETQTAQFLKEVEKYLKGKQKKDYNPSFVTEILKILQECIDNFTNDTFGFTIEYRMDLSLTACGYALKTFKDMAESYRNEHDTVKCLEKEKARYFQDFYDKYSKAAQEKIAARQCCELLESAIEKKVIKSLCLKVVQKMEDDDVNSFLFTKPALIKQMLVDIGAKLKKRDFELCFKYLRHPMETLKYYVKSVTEQYCDEGHPCSKLTVCARELLMESTTFVRRLISEISDCKTPYILPRWIDEFKTKLSLKFQIDGTIKRTFDAKGNIGFFTAELTRRLSILEDNLKNKFVLCAKDMETWEEKPYNLIFERVSGCQAACPFCKEPCNKTVRDHDGDHNVKLHRPQCLGGHRCRETGKMVLETCTEAVAKDSYFYYYHDSNEETHPYRRCEEIYPKWKIDTSLPGETSLFWKYVVAHIKSELAKLYGFKEDSVPEHWLSFELSQAINDL